MYLKDRPKLLIRTTRYCTPEKLKKAKEQNENF